MKGVEFDMVVRDSLEALSLYQKVFGAEVVEATSYERGLNEAVFTIMGSRFHLLDENPSYGLAAPSGRLPFWFNLIVSDIAALNAKMLDAGFTFIQPLTENADFGMKNLIASCPEGYVWMAHEITREVSFEERKKIMEEKMAAGGM